MFRAEAELASTANEEQLKVAVLAGQKSKIEEQIRQMCELQKISIEQTM